MPESIVRPLATPELADYHCHCDYSIDAEGTIESYCEAAIKRGLRELCFTTHYDTNPNTLGDANYINVGGKLVAATVANLAPYVDHVRRAAEQFRSQGLSVKVGIEFGYYPNGEEQAALVKEKYKLDYLLCGLHELDNICFCCKDEYAKCYSRYSLDRMLELYFQDMMGAAKSGVFDTIAHFDYYKKYGQPFYGEAVFSAHERFLPDVFQALRDSNTAIEINTAALRRGFPTHYPTPAILEAAGAAGVRVARLGSDAHKPEHVGWDFDNAFRLQSRALEAIRV